MLKAKQMPKKKQTKQTKKPAKNDGKITKKKYIKTKIIGGKMIQMLTLHEKLDFLKDCLKKAVSTTGNVEIPHDYFKLYSIISNLQGNYNDDIVFEKLKFDNIIHKGSSIYECLKNILLCLYDHDDYNSYTLLKLQYGDKATAQEKPTTKTFEFLDISHEKANELSTKSESYYTIYRKILEKFIKKIISVADAPPASGDGVVDADSSSDDPDGAPGGQREVAPEAPGAPGGEEGGAPGGEEGGAPGGEVQAAEEQEAAAEGTEQRSQFNGGFGIPFPKFTQQNAAITQDEREQDIFKTGMFQIYDEGIVLLTIDDKTNTKHTLKVFKSVDKVEDILDTPEAIINFFNTKKAILIIRRYNSNLTSTDYDWDCMIQLMYKLVNILIKNIDDYKKAIQTQLETNLKKPEFLLNYKTNLLDKLIVIIFEKFKAKAEAEAAKLPKAEAEETEAKAEAQKAAEEATAAKAEEVKAQEAAANAEAEAAKAEAANAEAAKEKSKNANRVANEARLNVVEKTKSAKNAAEKAAEKADAVKNIKETSNEKKAKGSVTRHAIILESLKIIAYNNNIDRSDIDNKYSKIFRDFITPTTDIALIVSKSNEDISKKLSSSCPSRIEFFQHIINVIYDPNTNTNIETLINLSTSYNKGVFKMLSSEDSCKTTIDNIVANKGYLISEAYILGEELKHSFSHITETSEMNEELNKIRDDYLNNMNDIVKESPDGTTKKKILSDFESVKQILKSQIKNKKDILNKTLPFQTTTSAPYNYGPNDVGRGPFKKSLIVTPISPFENKSREELERDARINRLNQNAIDFKKKQEDKKRNQEEQVDKKNQEET